MNTKSLELVPIDQDFVLAVVTKADGTLVTYQLSTEQFNRLQKAIEREENKNAR